MSAARGWPLAAVGCDVVSVRRIAETLARRQHFRSRVFTPRELSDARRGGVGEGTVTEHERLAARFAAKEAARKALGDLSLGFHDTEVRTDARGAPTLYVRGEPSSLTLSLSHDGDVAFAVVAGPARSARSAGPPPIWLQRKGRRRGEFRRNVRGVCTPVRIVDGSQVE